jgi:tRNA(fMet)-specific endonuclease VapC
MERALIDTDILSYFLKGDPAVVKKAVDYLEHYSALEISTSRIPFPAPPPCG